MHLLSNALPGLRDVRAPIIAGYLWLIFGWVLVTPDIDVRPHDRVAGPLYDLGHHVGYVGVGIAATVVAYFVGAVSQELSRAFARRFMRGRSAIGFQSRVDRELGYGSLLERAMIDTQKSLDANMARLTPNEQELMRERISERHEIAEAESQRELDLPATLLVGDRPELFSEVDRLRAEGELRLAVLPPLGFLVLLPVVGGNSLVWIGAIPALAVLLWQGLERIRDSRKIISDAIYFGRIESPSLKKYQEWYASVPDEINAAVRRSDQGTFD